MALPCPVCGSTGPVRISHAVGGRLEHQHLDTNTTCYPLDTRERYSIRCSGCGGALRFELYATPAVIASGVSRELACSCGARWSLEQVGRVNVYLGAA